MLLLTVLASIALIGGGFFVGMYFAAATETGSSMFLAKAGGGIGVLLSAMLWRKLLAYYRYGPDLKPIRSKEDRT